jgi:hypothetical protein
MRTLQATPSHFREAIAHAKTLKCNSVAWNLTGEGDIFAAVAVAKEAGIMSTAWLSASRDPEAAMAHPDWMHAPQHHEWLQKFPGFTGTHPALVASYIGLNTRSAFDYAIDKLSLILSANPWAETVYLSDIQGAPMGCGCGNPLCRSWDNAPGEKIAESPYNKPIILFPLVFWQTLQTRFPERVIVPILCPECERGIVLDGVDDPDGPAGTNLCQGIPCVRPCALDYWVRLLAAFRTATPRVGLLLLTRALEKDHSVYGEIGWAKRAHRHYGEGLLATIEPEDAEKFEGDALLCTDAPQTAYPLAPPEGFVPKLPPIMCGYCPPES